LKTKLLILIACVFLVIGYGCSQPQAPQSCAKTAGSTAFHIGKFDELPVHHETRTETLARILAESEAAKGKVDGPAHKEWYGSTLLGLGRLRRITVPYMPAGNDSASRQVTTPQIRNALSEYVLMDCESFHSSTHIPMGICVTMEYENGVIGEINIYGGIPWNVSLQKDGRVGEYGLGKTPEQSAPPKAAAPPR